MSQLELEPPIVLVTIPNIELISVGTWNALYGTAVFTKDDLQAIIAAVDDPAIHAPRLRIELSGDGPHTPPEVGPEESAGGFGEQPCFGRFVNLRLNETGTTIVGDLAGVPAWLAAVLPSAYPSRSVEVFKNVTTASGRTHTAVMTSVCCLSVSMPAVETLEDLRLAYGTEIPEGVEFTFSERITATKGAPMPARVSASVTYTDVRVDFYENVATSESDRYWWWVVDVILSPPTIIADDDEGGLWASPYAIKGDKITWGEPVEVRIQYVEVDGGKVVASKPDDLTGHRLEYVATDGMKLAAAPSEALFTAASSRPSDRVRAANDHEGASMNDEQKKLAAKLGLGEDATVEQLNAKLQADALAETPEEPETPVEPELGTEAPATEAVTLDPAAHAQLQADAKAGREARDEQIKARQTGKVDAAIKAGKFPPARREHYLSLMSKDEDGTTTFIDSLSAGTIPVTEQALAGDEHGTNAADMDRIRASFGLPTSTKGN